MNVIMVREEEFTRYQDAVTALRWRLVAVRAAGIEEWQANHNVRCGCDNRSDQACDWPMPAILAEDATRADAQQAATGLDG